MKHVMKHAKYENLLGIEIWITYIQVVYAEQSLDVSIGNDVRYIIFFCVCENLLKKILCLTVRYIVTEYFITIFHYNNYFFNELFNDNKIIILKVLYRV